MLVVEVAGAPGAGKTTLLPAVARACRAAGLRPSTVEEAARRIAAQTAAVRVVRRVSPRLADKMLWPVFCVARFLAALRFVLSRPELAWYLVSTQHRRPSEADRRGRRALYWFVRMAGAWEHLRRRGEAADVLLVDEGFVHRVVQLRTSWAEQPEAEDISRYVRLVPAADVLVAVEAPADVCARRVHSRGVWPRLGHLSPEQVDQFVANAHRAVQLAVAASRERGAVVVEVANVDDAISCGEQLARALEPALRDVAAAHRHVASLPALRVPRPARVVNRLSAQARSADIDEDVCETLLRAYGVTAVRPPDNVPFGGRNPCVVVHTGAGRKVLRRYRATTEEASILHEHAVLRELERAGFPAVRVCTTTTGGTLVSHERARYALFEHVQGTNLTSCVIPRTQQLRLVEMSGALLARLHQALAGFEPPTTHHLGYAPESGDRAHDLSWYLEALRRMPFTEAAADAEVRAHHEALLSHRRWLAERLGVLHDVLGDADLPRSVIHGDFGMHNLLFRDDGGVVVLDFELARREWRLLDLAIVGTRTPPERVRPFLASYRLAADVPEAEWRRLPQVYEFHLLTGAVRAWHGYAAVGDEKRLFSASRRVELARAAPEEVAVLC